MGSTRYDAVCTAGTDHEAVFPSVQPWQVVVVVVGGCGGGVRHGGV